MDVGHIVECLMALEGPNRRVDFLIAKVAGYRAERRAGEGGTSPVHILIPPGPGMPAVVPAYTASVEQAYNLAQQLQPTNVGGCSWEAGSGSARIGGSGDYFTAANAAIAICLAIFSAQLSRNTSS